MRSRAIVRASRPAPDSSATALAVVATAITGRPSPAAAWAAARSMVVLPYPAGASTARRLPPAPVEHADRFGLVVAQSARIRQSGLHRRRVDGRARPPGESLDERHGPVLQRPVSSSRPLGRAGAGRPPRRE